MSNTIAHNTGFGQWDTLNKYLHVEATGAKSNRIVALRVMVNGRGLTGGKGVTSFDAPALKADATWDIEIPPGRHEVKVLIRGEESSELTAPLILETELPESQRPNLHMLSVGVKTYRNSALNLKVADKDARDLFAAFQTYCKGPTNLFRDVVGTTLTNEEAQRERVLQSIREVRKSIRQQDMFILFFSGHGVKEGKDFYFVTHEADLTPNADNRADRLPTTAISGAELQSILADFPCQVLLILDACHASKAVASFMPAIDDTARREITNSDVGVAILCATMGKEKADESSENGHLTAALIRGLEAKDANVPFNHHNYRQYIHHLHSYVFDEVTKVSKEKQHPFLHLPWTVSSFPLRKLPDGSTPRN